MGLSSATMRIEQDVGTADGLDMAGRRKIFVSSPVLNAVRSWSTSGERHALRGEQVRKRALREERIFALTQMRQRVEPLQLGVDEARVAHDHAAVRQALEEAREQRREIRRRGVVVGAGEARIGAQAKPLRAAAEAAAEEVEQQSLAIGESPQQRQAA